MNTKHDIFDIECGAEDEATVMRFTKPYPDFVPVGPFDPAAVKYGNRKSEEARASYLEEARQKHAELVANARSEWEAGKEAHRQKALADAALDPKTGRILAIGIEFEDGEVEIRTAETNEQEKEMILWFLKLVAKYIQNRDKLVGFNILGYDVRFIYCRALKYGLREASILMSGRYWSDVFIDLMQVWIGGDRSERYVSLDTLLDFFGLPPKSGCGADFAKKFANDRPAAIQYLRDDVDREMRLARHIGVIPPRAVNGSLADIAA